MGLQQDMQIDLADAFDNVLADIVKSFILSKNDGVAYNPANGQQTTTGTTTGTWRGVFNDPMTTDMTDSPIDDYTTEVICLQSDKPFAPEVGHVIIMGDGSKYDIVRVATDPADVIYQLLVKD